MHVARKPRANPSVFVDAPLVLSFAKRGGALAIVAGPTPTSTAAKVALLASNGVTATTEPVAGGYYLVYAPAELSVASLVFYDARGQLVNELALHPHA